MIELYEGRLGGGKTYSATVRMVDHVRRGGVVCTNVEIKWDAVKDYIAKQFGLVAEDEQFIPLTDDEIGLFHRHTPSGTPELPVLVVIDEAHLTFNARDFAQTDKLYRETLTFLTQSRKVNTDVIFIAQSVLNMDKQFMRLVQFIWRFRDLGKWKIPGLGIKYPFKQLLAVQFDYDGKTILQRSFVNKDKRIFGLYNTNSLIRQFPRLQATTTKRTLAQVKAKNDMMKFVLPLGVAFGIVCAFILYKKVSNIGTPKQTATQATNTIATPSTASGSRSVDTTKHTKEEDKQKTAYDIYAEEFQGWNSVDRSLKTKESGWYQVGEMSSRGYVTAVSDRRARVAQPDGRTGWVVATRNSEIKPAPTESIPPPPSPPPKIITVPKNAPESIPTPIPTVTPLNDNDFRALRSYKTGRNPILDKAGSQVDNGNN
jgi:hypothetical protein